MSSDWRESKEEHDITSERPSPRLGKSGQLSIQGHLQPERQDELEDHSFVDREGRAITLRTFPSGDHYYIRAYDQHVRQPPETLDTGQAGYANLQVERGTKGTRARLQDIKTSPSYEQSGIGGQMLTQAEGLARRNGCYEIYGLAPDDTQTLNWYAHRGYRLRENDYGGREVSKGL